MLKLTINEANCIADICNPGFDETLYPGGVGRASSLKASVSDTFFVLYPFSFGKKWQIDESALWAKLDSASQTEMEQLCDAVTRFWQECEQGKQMDAYYPVTGT